MYQVLAMGVTDELLFGIQSLTFYDLRFITSLSVQDAKRLLVQQAIHLLIIDLKYLRSIKQAEWLTEIRRISFVPVIVLSDTPDEDIKSMVHLGADVCVPKKWANTTIASLAFAQLRRYTEYNHSNDPAHAEAAPFQRGDIFIDPARQKVEVCGRHVNLRNREFSLLLYFMRNPGIVLTAGQICENAWGMDYTQPIDRAIHELRKQIEPNPHKPHYIKTVHRVGYCFMSYSSETCER